MNGKWLQILFRKINPEYDLPVDICREMIDPMIPYYSYIDFDRSVIGGSYALHKYTRDCNWTPDDVDIMVFASDLDDFRSMVKKFRDDSGGRLIKFNDFSHGHPNNHDHDSKREEFFNECIKASATIIIDGLDHPIQYVYVESLHNRTLVETLEEITDLPACVNYTVRKGKIYYNVPARAVMPLRTRDIHIDQICPVRREKYEARGYRFYKD